MSQYRVEIVLHVTLPKLDTDLWWELFDAWADEEGREGILQDLDEEFGLEGKYDSKTMRENFVVYRQSYDTTCWLAGIIEDHMVNWLYTKAQVGDYTEYVEEIDGQVEMRNRHLHFAPKAQS
jgi:hypothetical protein